MESLAKHQFILSSPRKMRLVANEIRGYDVLEVVDILAHTSKKAAGIILKVVKSAMANAKVINAEIKEQDLYLKKIYVDEGSRMKRFKPSARGRASRRLRRTSNLTVVLSDE